MAGCIGIDWNTFKYVVDIKAVVDHNKKLHNASMGAVLRYMSGKMTHSAFMGKGNKPARKTCSKGHESIQFKSENCPLCRALKGGSE